MTPDPIAAINAASDRNEAAGRPQIWATPRFLAEVLP